MDEDSLPVSADDTDAHGAPGGKAAPGRIGPYVLLRKLGEGGMGEVWEGQQEEPIRRRVALKLIRAGMDTRQVLARFEAERQALALMNHPGIARVLGGGRDELGRPFFVMELVDGTPITDYCDAHRLSIPERIELFIEVCRAVQHAHQKGIIHRDLKPSNVLVATVDDRPVPKVIDFGVAKATADALQPDDAGHTRYGQYVGTPGHMSPEQMEPGPIDIDTRCDVYSLGVLLYELLVGERPFVSRGSAPPSDQELRRKIRDEVPPLPSQRLAGRAGDEESGAVLRDTDSRSLRRSLRGDLDWIALRALEKDRSRRYGSASELAADLERHLANEPVSAGPPSAAYRLHKFVLRHRFAVAVAASLAMLLVFAIVAISLALVRARTAEAAARAEAARTETVTSFLVELFDMSDPSEAGGEKLSARELLDRGAERIASGMDEQPLTQVMLLVTMGRVYLSLGLPDEAEPLAQRALELTDERLDGNPVTRSSGLFLLAEVERRRGNTAQSLELAERSLALRRSHLPPQDPLIAWGLDLVGSLLKDLGRYDEAMERFEEALETQRAVPEPDSTGTAQALHNIGWLHHLLGHTDEALESLEEAARIYRLHDPEGLWLTTVLRDEVFVLSARGEYEAARRPLEQALALQEKILGPEHPDLAILLEAAGSLHWYAEEYQEARRYYRRSLAIREATLPPDHPWIAQSVGNLGLVARALRRFDEAERLMRRGLDLARARHGDDHVNEASILNNLGLLLLRLRRTEEGGELIRQAADIWQRTFPPEHPKRIESSLSLAMTELGLGRATKALALAEGALELVAENSSAPVDLLVRSRFLVANAARLAGQEDRSRTVIEELVTELDDVDKGFVASILMLSALSRLRDGNFEEAARLHDQALAEASTREPDPILFYAAACFAALRGDRRRALDLLARADTLGANLPLELDPALASLHGDPEFEELVRRFRQPWYRGDAYEEEPTTRITEETKP